ncbi:MAG: hypothetical protein H7A49_00180 [Akkermansiaceae bacterium]|nr:hypothetical protein [Akkermansiaceae bacterium]MCP5542299.1 hypothetical protein [Akkermansiaceae bacterium]MCP5546164.1 hypothetical protein [Akkermansiaceae bacterium]
MSEPQDQGRFLPSRVYRRWVWPLRACLSVLPMALLLSGMFALYFGAQKFRSESLFQIENGPSPEQLVAMIHSDAVLNQTIRNLHGALGNIQNEDARKVLHHTTDADLVEPGPLLRVRATHTSARTAQQVAMAMPEALLTVIDGDRVARHKELAARHELQIADARASAEEQSVRLSRLESASPPTSPAVLAQAREELRIANEETRRLLTLHNDLLREQAADRPRLSNHTDSRIASGPISPKYGEEMARIAWQSLATGLLAALLIPYLLELVFPPFRRPAKPSPSWETSAALEKSVIPRVGV